MSFFFPPWPSNTVSAFDIICRSDRNDTLEDVPQNTKQKAATGLFLDKLFKQDFAGPLSSRASKVLGPISRHRVADILPTCNLFRVLLGLGYSLASFESSVMGCVLHGDYTLQRTIMHAAGICLGNDSSPHTCATGARMSTIYDPCSTQATAIHAARVWSWWEFG